MENVAVAPFLHCAEPLAGSYVTSLLMCGFIAQLVEQRTGNAEASSFQLLKLENLLR